MEGRGGADSSGEGGGLAALDENSSLQPQHSKPNRKITQGTCCADPLGDSILAVFSFSFEQGYSNCIRKTNEIFYQEQFCEQIYLLDYLIRRRRFSYLTRKINFESLFTIFSYRNSASPLFFSPSSPKLHLPETLRLGEHGDILRVFPSDCLARIFVNETFCNMILKCMQNF